MLRLGIDIGGTNIIVGLLEENGTVLGKRKMKTPFHTDENAFVHFVVEIITELVKSCGKRLDEVGFCGVGIPGTVSADGRVAVKAPNLGWKDLPLGELLQNTLQIPVRLLQDSRAAAYGEYRVGGGAGCSAVVCMTLGTGIGTGVVLGGQVYNGALGCAGELGHVPVVSEGVECGCGQKGCLECYAAGKGLNRRARELFGEKSSSEELFDRARSGDSQARAILWDAVEKLGTVVVSMINLLSPDCVLFSGGLSKQRELFVDPLIDFVREKHYRLGNGDNLRISVAALGEDAPMVGAALQPFMANARKPKISASLMCANWLNLGEELNKLEAAGIEYLHYDIMDGHFVPNMMLPPELLAKVRMGTSLPYDIHIMAENPEQIIPQLPVRDGDIVTVHCESTVHLQRALAQARDRGATPAVALNPATPVEMIRDVLPDVGMILIMTVNPGFAGQKIVPQCLDKIGRARRLLDEAGYSQITIAVDGNCSFENIPKLYEAGAEVFVVGSSSLFSNDVSIKEAALRIRKSLHL